MYGYEKLDVWQVSMGVVESVYKILKAFPKEERYALSDQIRRSAVSVPSNIAEGSGRQTTKEFIQFLYIAMGSACELETQLKISLRLGYSQDLSVLLNQLSSVKRMLNALISSLKRKL